MNLTIDIGNSRTKLALFNGDLLVLRWHWEEWTITDLLLILTNHKVKNVILSTVGRKLAATDLELLGKQCHWMQLEAETPLPIQMAYKTPQTLGKDRIAAVVGAFALFPGQNCLVVDAGTCVTYEFLNEDAWYLGGNIAPGLRMRLRAMHEFTARLPEVDLAPIEHWIGNTTSSAMLNGALLGMAHEVEGYARKWAETTNNIQTILTGGDADVLRSSLNLPVIIEPDLLFIGLNKILKYNVE